MFLATEAVLLGLTWMFQGQNRYALEREAFLKAS